MVFILQQPLRTLVCSMVWHVVLKGLLQRGFSALESPCRWGQGTRHFSCWREGAGDTPEGFGASVGVDSSPAPGRADSPLTHHAGGALDSNRQAARHWRRVCTARQRGSLCLEGDNNCKSDLLVQYSIDRFALATWSRVSLSASYLMASYRLEGVWGFAGLLFFSQAYLLTLLLSALTWC